MLLVDSGGYFGLSNVSIKGPVALRLMEIMEYDVYGIGDQELFQGLASFLERFGWFRENITNASLSNTAGEPLFTPYRIKTVNGVRLGILGLVSNETFRFFPKERKDFLVEEPDVTVGRILPELKKKCDYIIVLSQMGVEQDQKFAQKWPDIGLIIGGHSQTLLEEGNRYFRYSYCTSGEKRRKSGGNNTHIQRIEKNRGFFLIHCVKFPKNIKFYLIFRRF